MLTENYVQITFFYLLDSFKLQFLASYFYHFYDIDPLFWNAKFHLCGSDTIIYRSKKYLHGLLYNLPYDFDKLQVCDKFDNIVLNSNTESIGVWCVSHLKQLGIQLD